MLDILALEQSIPSRLLGDSSLPELPKHTNEIIEFLALFQFVYIFLSPFISTRCFPKTYLSLSSAAKIRWDDSAVSLSQATIISFFSAILLFWPESRDVRKRRNFEERVHGTGEAEGFLLSIAFGYFIWHLVMMIVHVKVFGWTMVVHAVTCFFCILSAYRPFLFHWYPLFLFVEVTNIFRNIYYFLGKIGMENSILGLTNGILFTLSFFFIRIVYLFYQTPEFVRDLMLLSTGYESEGKLVQKMSLPWALMPLALHGVLSALNIYWFGLIIRIVVGKVSGGGKRKGE